ncbi:MAG: hypothetical protein ACMUIL_05920 [bacterium]
MNILTKAWILSRIIQWRISIGRYNVRRRYVNIDNPKFKSAIDAATMIHDGDVIAFSGLAGNARPAAMYYAIKHLFRKTGHPRRLTVISAGGQGGRGKIPSTLEEIGIKGLCTRLIAGHLETYKSFLRLADKNKMELHCIPQGLCSLLYNQQANGKNWIITETGKGTFVDPECGRGSPVGGKGHHQLVTIEEEKLRFEMPCINVAIFNAPAADRRGNIYMKNAVMVSDHRDIAHAAKKNNGIVIANVGQVVDEGYDEIFLSGDQIDAVVVDPKTEQTMVFPHRRHFPHMTLHGNASPDKGLEMVRFINKIMGITPIRTEINSVLARVAATQVVQHAFKGCHVNIGVGLPEEVCCLLYDSGLLDEDITLFTEAGIVGGIPTPGIFFGGAISPREMIDASALFKRTEEGLDLAIFGALQIDGEGNVNVSKRGEGVINYVGPGGFIDLSSHAKVVIFMSTWMAHARIVITDMGIRIETPGKPKFVDKVDEISFNGKVALGKGQKVIYITEPGVFELTARGMELKAVMPGIDIRKDILGATPMRIILPEQGDIPVVPLSVVTGKDFMLELSTVEPGKTSSIPTRVHESALSSK